MAAEGARRPGAAALEVLRRATGCGGGGVGGFTTTFLTGAGGGFNAGVLGGTTVASGLAGTLVGATPVGLGGVPPPRRDERW